MIKDSTPSGTKTYRVSWYGDEGAYDVDIRACDVAGQCSEIIKVISN